MAALKYFILKVDPKKTILFNPKESIDFNGNTGPFVLYTYARIQSIFRKLAEKGIERQSLLADFDKATDVESTLVQQIAAFPAAVNDACTLCSPAQIANYVYELSKQFNQFYHDHQIIGEPDAQIREFRLLIAQNTGKIIKNCLNMLGIGVLDKM